MSERLQTRKATLKFRNALTEEYGECKLKEPRGERVGHVPASCSAAQGHDDREGKVRPGPGVEATFSSERNPGS